MRRRKKTRAARPPLALRMARTTARLAALNLKIEEGQFSPTGPAAVAELIRLRRQTRQQLVELFGESAVPDWLSPERDEDC